jgi:hypothetical protein
VEPNQAPETPDASSRPVGAFGSGEQRSRALELERSARLSWRLAELAARPRRRKAPPLAPDLACGLYRQSAYYSLRALELLEPTAAAAPGNSDFASLFQAVSPAVLVSAAGDAERLQTLEPRLCASTFVDFASAETAETSALARELRDFTRSLLKEVEVRQRRAEVAVAARSLRVLALAVALGAVGVLLLLLPEWLEARRDLAAGKPWQASSLSYTGNCESPAQECPGEGNYFFHTQQEEEPWVEIDLKSTQKMSSARIVNRTDCCIDRGIPLILEVSNDQKRWREVAKVIDPFREWKPTFAPVAARWVRLRVPKNATLHLKRVRIFP